MPKIKSIRNFFFGNTNDNNMISVERNFINTKNKSIATNSRFIKRAQQLRKPGRLGLPTNRYFFSRQNATIQQVNDQKIKLRLSALEYILHGQIELLDLNRLYLKKIIRLNNGKLTKVERKQINSLTKSSEKYFEKAARLRYTDKQLNLD